MKTRTKLIALFSGIFVAVAANAAPMYLSSAIDLGIENPIGISNTTVTASIGTLAGNMENALCAICTLTNSKYSPSAPVTTGTFNAIALNAKEGMPFSGSISIPLTIHVTPSGGKPETISTDMGNNKAPVINFTGIGKFTGSQDTLTDSSDPDLVCQTNLESETDPNTKAVLPLLVVKCFEL